MAGCNTGVRLHIGNETVGPAWIRSDEFVYESHYGNSSENDNCNRIQIQMPPDNPANGARIANL